MKFGFFVMASLLMTVTAHANQYQNYIAASAQLDCKTTFEGTEKTLVETTKVNLDASQEAVKSLEVSSVVKIGAMEVKRKYVVDMVKYDVFTEEDLTLDILQQPTIVEGKQPKTGEELKIFIDQNDLDEDNFGSADIYINGKVQNYLKIACRVLFAG